MRPGAPKKIIGRFTKASPDGGERGTMRAYVARGPQRRPTTSLRCKCTALDYIGCYIDGVSELHAV